AAMRAGLGRSARLVTVPQGALRQVARLAGKQAAFERISGPLVVSTARLTAAGWTAPVQVADGLARFAAQSTSPA
ncbi:MAG: NAD-dependent dehydratase, partial [Pseudomonadota bacterium]